MYNANWTDRRTHIKYSAHLHVVQNFVTKSLKYCYYTYQWLDNVDMYTYAQFDQNISYGTIVMSNFTNC